MTDSRHSAQSEPMTSRVIVDQLAVASAQFAARADKVEELTTKVGELIANRGVVMGVQNAVESLECASRWAEGVGHDVFRELRSFDNALVFAKRLLHDFEGCRAPGLEQAVENLRETLPRSGEQILGLDVAFGGVSVREEIALVVNDLGASNPRTAQQLSRSVNIALALANGMADIHRGTFDVAVALSQGRAPSFSFLRGSR